MYRLITRGIVKLAENLLSSLSSYSKSGIVVVSRTTIENFSLSNEEEKTVQTIHLPYPGVWYVYAKGWNFEQSVRLSKGNLALKCRGNGDFPYSFANCDLTDLTFSISGLTIIQNDEDVLFTVTNRQGVDFTSLSASANFVFAAICLGNYSPAINLDS